MIAYILHSSYLMHDLLEISPRTIIEFLHYYLWYWHMTRISEMSLSVSVFHIDQPSKPMFLSYAITIHATLHAYEVICLWTEKADGYCSIFRTSSQLREGEWHIRDSRSHTIPLDININTYEIRTGRESLSYSIGFRSIGGTKSKEHNYANSKQVIAAIPNMIQRISSREIVSPNFQ